MKLSQAEAKMLDLFVFFLWVFSKKWSPDLILLKIGINMPIFDEFAIEKKTTNVQIRIKLWTIRQSYMVECLYFCEFQ